MGLIELGGGFRPADLSAYFSGLNLPSPRVTAVSVDQAANSPTGDANGPDGEVMLDVEVVGAIAPAASIVVYFAPNTDAGFLDAITTAIHDTKHHPSILSISWGGPESTWTSQAMSAMDDAFQAAATLGITICVASGDNGSRDGVSDGGDHVDFPASSPFVLACGGTSLARRREPSPARPCGTTARKGAPAAAGVSSFFALPVWQKGLSARTVQGRTVPLAHARRARCGRRCRSETGYDVRVDGADTVIGGTSAVAPLWAALIARINESAGERSGLHQSAALRRCPVRSATSARATTATSAAQAGWDACTGLGSPNGGALAGII